VSAIGRPNVLDENNKRSVCERIFGGEFRYIYDIYGSTAFVQHMEYHTCMEGMKQREFSWDEDAGVANGLMY
jgi:hypothetical protein